MKWAFIDYENIGCLSKVDLSIYTKVILFLGARQPKIDLGDKKYDAPIELILIQLKATQSNNLDFHLAYYLGKYEHEADTHVSFEIISNDNGFGPLIAHVKQNGRSCRQVKVSAEPNQENKLVSSLTSKPKEKRPQKISSLRNHIASHMRVQGNDVAIQQHLNHLINVNLVQVSGDSVTYTR